MYSLIFGIGIKLFLNIHKAITCVFIYGLKWAQNALFCHNWPKKPRCLISKIHQKFIAKMQPILTLKVPNLIVSHIVKKFRFNFFIKLKNGTSSNLLTLLEMFYLKQDLVKIPVWQNIPDNCLSSGWNKDWRWLNTDLRYSFYELKN